MSEKMQEKDMEIAALKEELKLQKMKSTRVVTMAPGMTKDTTKNTLANAGSPPTKSPNSRNTKRITKRLTQSLGAVFSQVRIFAKSLRNLCEFSDFFFKISTDSLRVIMSYFS